MTLQEAIMKSMRAYFDEDTDTTLAPELGNTKYTMEYFNDLQEKLMKEYRNDDT